MKKLSAFILSLIVIVHIIPLYSYAWISANNYEVGQTVSFGSYPQSRVTEGAILSQLNIKDLTWVSYNYYSEGKQSDYMQYADAFIGSDRYRAVKFTSYRPSNINEKSTTDPDISYQNDNGYEAGEIYWFAYEPLEWRILDVVKGLVVCDKVIDSQSFCGAFVQKEGEDKEKIYYTVSGESCYANNYEQSNIRRWLNDDFFNTAFTYVQQGQIARSTLNNTAFDQAYTGFSSEQTTDLLFLLSYKDSVNANFGFDAAAEHQDKEKKAEVTDYAKCQGWCGDGTNGNSSWGLRTAGEGSGMACGVSDKGQTTTSVPVYSTCVGVRPALTVMDMTDFPATIKTVDDGKNTKALVIMQIVSLIMMLISIIWIILIVKASKKEKAKLADAAAVQESVKENDNTQEKN